MNKLFKLIFVLFLLVSTLVVAESNTVTSVADYESSSTNEFLKQAELFIKQKAIDVAKQIEIYITLNPDKTVLDLQNDSYFQEIAVQQVGKSGYTAVTDYNSLIARFHVNPSIVNLDLHNLADKLPGFWNIMSKTEGGVEAEGIYDWEEADGSIKQKYMHIVLVNAKTADGVGLHVAATTYLDEYESGITLTSKEELLSEISLEKLVLKNIQDAKIVFDVLNEKDVTTLKNLMTNFMEQEEYKKIFLEGDRDKLYNSVVEMFNKNKEVYDITHFYFYNLNGTNLLRVHNKDIFGDEITRITFEQSKLSNSWGAGIELGKTAFALRVVHPYYYNGELIGYVEFGQEIDKFINAMKQQTGFDYGIVVKKDFIDEHEWAFIRELKGLRNNYYDMDDFLLIDSTDKTNLLFNEASFNENHFKLSSDEGSMFHEFSLGEKTFVDGGFALYDAGGNKVGTVVVIQDISQFKEEVKSEELSLTKLMFVFIGVGIIILIIVFFLYKLKLIHFEKNTVVILLSISLLLILGLFLFNTYNVTQSMKEERSLTIASQLSTIANLQSKFIQEYLKEQEYRLKIFAIDEELSIEEQKKLVNNINEFNELFILNSDGIVIASSNEQNIGLDKSTEEAFLFGKIETYFKSVYYSETEEKIFFSISIPYNEGVLVANLNTEVLVEKFNNEIGMGETGESLVAFRNRNGDAEFFSKRRFETEAEAQDIIPKENTEIPITQALLNNQDVFLDFNDYRNTPVIAVTNYIPELDVGIVTKMDEAEVVSFVEQTINSIWTSTAGIMFAILIIGIVFNFLLTNTLRKEVDEKTNELQKITTNLEITVKERTKELEESRKELQLHEEELETLVENKTVELNNKVEELEKTRTAVLNILEDVSLSKEELEISEKRLVGINKELNAANKEMKKMDKYKSEFISVTAHELKTPLASIHGFATLLQNKKILENKTQRDYYLSIVMKDADRLKQLIDDILDLSRLDLGTMKFFFEKINLSELVKDVVNELYVMAAKKQVELEMNVDSKIQDAIVDKSRLSQVIVNLVNNAVKYSDKPNTKIIISVKKQDKELLFAVKDEGTGIEKKNLKKIFERFYQADSSYTRKVGGTGLGLAISKGIIEVLGGSMWVESKLNKGSTFYFTLPTTKRAEGEHELTVFNRFKENN